jgi:ribosome biogenesis GTPase
MRDVATLELLGWDAAWSAAFEPYRENGLVPGRVSVQHRGEWDVVTEGGEVRARVPGRLRHEALSRAHLPVVGDWVAMSTAQKPEIRAVLPRRTQFSRRAAHEPGSQAVREQVVAANIDVVFVTAPLSDDVNARVVERYLTLAWESGAQPVILLTKADLEPDPAAVAAEVEAIGGEVPVHAVSSLSGLGLDAVRRHVPPGVTGALLGPSGAGKSTLVNTLAGEELLATAAVREDGSGRHTTTRRELVVLPQGGLVVDNPGMREVHLWLADEGLEDAFDDIAELAAGCKFSDCRHESEPGCAVHAALADGGLARERWQSYRDLQRELAELEESLARRERSRARRGRPGAGTS